MLCGTRAALRTNSGPPLVPGRGRRRYRPTTAKEYLEIVFWTFVVYAAWVGWNYWIWGWI